MEIISSSDKIHQLLLVFYSYSCLSVLTKLKIVTILKGQHWMGRMNG